ncbi:protein lifeguard 1-like [Chrysoperla carnea]|uniref:protein lifeguard 1-like n=1 Tax=Chrysoperla carnea TaxID=189513 RepID=UPI001D06AAC1|nr:protein lifeguard 1-like [Chrysoperla carnea]
MDSFFINIDSTIIEPNIILPIELQTIEIVKDFKKESAIDLCKHTSLNTQNEELEETEETYENTMPIRPKIEIRPPEPPSTGIILSRSPFFSEASSRNRDPEQPAMIQGDSQMEIHGRSEKWKDQNERHRFVVRVLAITLMGLGITTMFSVFMLLSDPFLRLLYSPPLYIILLVSAGLLSIISLGISCFCNKITLRGPYAILHYFVWVYILTVMVLYTISVSPIENVVIALATTVFMVGIALLIIRFVKFDFTKYVWIVMVGLAVVFFAMILVSILSFWLKVTMARAIISFIAAVLIFFVLIIDLQMVMGGRRIELDTDMYWFGALCLYTDIVLLFLYLLDALNQSSS